MVALLSLHDASRYARADVADKGHRQGFLETPSLTRGASYGLVLQWAASFLERGSIVRAVLTRQRLAHRKEKPRGRRRNLEYLHMTSSVEQALMGLAALVTNARRPLPDPDTLVGYVATFGDLQREDGTNIVMQFQGGTVRPLDGGDSDHRTGVLAFCGSQLDADNLDLFQKDGVMFRHPTQSPWNNPNNCTRDQLIGYIAGCWRTGRTDIVESLFEKHEARGFTCQDIENDEPGTLKVPPVGDPLAPHDLMYFRICKGERAAASDLVSQLALYTWIQSAPSDPHEEKNQLLLQAIVGCQLDLLLAAHPALEQSLHDYWDKRGMTSIATSLWEVVSIERRRYITPNVLDFFLPANILAELREINWHEALEAFKNLNPIYFIELAGKVVLAALRDIEHYAQILMTGLRTVQNIEQEIVSAVLKSLHIQASGEIAKIGILLANVAIDGPIGILSMALNTAASLLGFGSSNRGDSDAEIQFRKSTTDSLRDLSTTTKQVLKSLSELQLSMEKQFAALTKTIHDELYGVILINLVAESDNAVILINTLKATPADPDIRRRLGDQVDRLRVLIDRSAAKGSEALAICFHVYGTLVSCLTALGNDTEIEETRKAVGKTLKGLLVGPDGLNKTIIGLDNEMAAANQAFSKCLGRMLVGAISIPCGFQRNMDDTKDLIQNPGYDVTGVWCTMSGTFDPVNVALTFSNESMPYSPVPYTVADGTNGMNVFSGAFFCTGNIAFGRDLSKYHTSNLDELRAAELARLEAKVQVDAGPAVLKYLQDANEKLANAKGKRPGFSALAASVTAAFADRQLAEVAPALMKATVSRVIRQQALLAP